MRSLSFLPHLGHFSSITGTAESLSFFACASGMPALPETIPSSARSRSRVKVLSKSDRAFVQESLPSSTSSRASSMRAV